MKIDIDSGNKNIKAAKTQYEYELAGAAGVRKRNFDRCPNCGVHSDRIIHYLKLWECQNDNCRVGYFYHE